MRPTGTLRFKLLMLLLGTMLPLLVMALANAWFSYRAERDRLERSTETVARGVALGVALEVQRGLAGLNALALSRPLCAGDLATFRDQLTRFMEAQHPGGNAVLTDPDGQQLLNLLAPPGQRLPRRRNLDLLRETFQRGSAVVSGVYGGTFRERVVTIEVPVYCQGIASYNLALAPRLDIFAAVLHQQHAPQDWTLLLMDAEGQVVAQSGRTGGAGARLSKVSAERFSGNDAPEVRARAAPAGGTHVHTPVGDFGWAVQIRRPLESVRADLARSFAALLLGGLLLVALGAAFALSVARTLIRPMERLSRVASESGAMARTALPPSGVREIDVVANRLQDALLQLRLADQRKDDFIATLAHELRNPLAPLTHAMTLLQRKEEIGEDGRRLTAIAQRQLSQMKRLVSDLLELGRLGQGKLSIELQPIDLREPVSDAVESVGPRLHAKQQQLAVDLPPQPLLVRGDEQRLAQVVSNLLDNASKYSPAGANVYLSAAVDGNQVRLDVRDDGQGLDPDQAARVFDMYWQAGSASAGGSGLGIGLALVRRLVEAHDGKVSASSEGAGKGCTFSIWLPGSP